MQEINLDIIKNELKKREFRNKFPELKEEIDKWINNPDCPCNVPLYNTILSNIIKLKEYFGEDIVILNPVQDEQTNNWKVINCNINELEQHLINLSHGPKQIAVARWEDEVTVVINEPVFN